MTTQQPNNGGPAYPVPGLQHDEDFYGMSLRDYFAAKVIGHLAVAEGRQECSIEDDVRLAFKYADAMLEARGQ